MTVIACNRKEMACDTQTTGDDGSITHTKKVFKLPDGSLLGLAGNCKPIDLVLHWYMDGCRGPCQAVKKVDLVRLSKDGIFTRYSDVMEYPVETEFFGIGCGAQGAMVAMRKGANPRRAIIDVCEDNAYCSCKDGKPQVEKL